MLVKVCGLDIGGKSIKVCWGRFRNAGSEYYAESIPKFGDLNLDRLLKKVSQQCELVVVTETITANRAWCHSMEDGLRRLVSALESYLLDRCFFIDSKYSLLSLRDALDVPWQVICRNWIGGCYLFTSISSLLNGLYVDFGTNSTDVIPVSDGRPHLIHGDSDRFWTRLGSGELLWTGMLFSPVTSICSSVHINGVEYNTKETADALMGDVYLVLGSLSIQDLQRNLESTDKNGNKSLYVYFDREVSLERSIRKLCNVVAIPAASATHEIASKIATYVKHCQMNRIGESLSKVIGWAEHNYGSRPKYAVISGSGRSIASKAARKCGLNSLDGLIELEKAKLTLSGDISNCENAIGCAVRAMNMINPLRK